MAAISSVPPPTVGQASLGKAAPAASLLLWAMLCPLFDGRTSQLRFPCRAGPSAIEQGQGRPGHAFEQGAIRVRARQNANAQHHAEQQSRSVRPIHCARHRSRRLCGGDVAPEERGDFFEIGGNAGAQLRVVGRNLEGGVHQQAAAAVRIGNRSARSRPGRRCEWPSWDRAGVRAARSARASCAWRSVRVRAQTVSACRRTHCRDWGLGYPCARPDRAPTSLPGRDSKSRRWRHPEPCPRRTIGGEPRALVSPRPAISAGPASRLACTFFDRSIKNIVNCGPTGTGAVTFVSADSEAICVRPCGGPARPLQMRALLLDPSGSPMLARARPGVIAAMPGLAGRSRRLACQGRSGGSGSSEGWSKTDFSKSRIGWHEILSGGPPKDGIPSIDKPHVQGCRRGQGAHRQ